MTLSKRMENSMKSMNLPTNSLILSSRGIYRLPTLIGSTALKEIYLLK